MKLIYKQTIMQYTSFASGSKPKSYPYDNRTLIEEGFEHIASANPKNPELDTLCKENEENGKECRKVLNSESLQIDLWIR